jgi:heme oxygenase-like protein
MQKSQAEARTKGGEIQESMAIIDAPAAVAELMDHVDNTLSGSRFFTGLARGSHSLEHVRDVFSQYYWWRNRFHRWFGVCIARSEGFGTRAPIEFVLSELIEHIGEEIKGDHHGLCQRALRQLGVTDFAAIRPLPLTEAYTQSFIDRYACGDRSGEEALAALAGRELLAPKRNRMTIDALNQHYGIREGLEFFSLHEELEVEHFKGLWEAVGRYEACGPDRLVRAAQEEITLHMRFWDQASAALA